MASRLRDLPHPVLIYGRRVKPRYRIYTSQNPAPKFIYRLYCRICHRRVVMWCVLGGYTTKSHFGHRDLDLSEEVWKR